MLRLPEIGRAQGLALAGHARPRRRCRRGRRNHRRPTSALLLLLLGAGPGAARLDLSHVVELREALDDGGHGEGRTLARRHDQPSDLEEEPGKIIDYRFEGFYCWVIICYLLEQR